VPLLLDTALVDLISENGRVTGVMVEHAGERRTLHARRGVILASGGFEHNAEMRAKYQNDECQEAHHSSQRACGYCSAADHARG